MKKLLLALPVLLASCQSERVAFHFQPVAPAVGVAGRSSTPAAAAPVPVVAEAPARAVPGTAAASGRPAAARRRAGRPLTSPAAPAGVSALATTAARPSLTQRLVLKRLGRRLATHGQARVAESGLGGIALFFIAIVLGLLAGLGALVSLIPGISFFGGVGLAAAGLLVIFLLYSLLSGGKKKKPAAR